MDIPEDQAKQSLLKTNNQSVEVALNWHFENNVYKPEPVIQSQNPQPQEADDSPIINAIKA